MVIILLAVEIFIEKSAMISEKFHPLIGLWHRIQRKSRKIFKKVAKMPTFNIVFTLVC